MQKDGITFHICPQWLNLSLKPPWLSGWPFWPGQHHFPNTKESSLQPNHKLLSSWHKKGKNIQFNRTKPLFINHFWSTLPINVLETESWTGHSSSPSTVHRFWGIQQALGHWSKDACFSLPNFLLEPLLPQWRCCQLRGPSSTARMTQVNQLVFYLCRHWLIQTWTCAPNRTDSDDAKSTERETLLLILLKVLNLAVPERQRPWTIPPPNFS